MGSGRARRANRQARPGFNLNAYTTDGSAAREAKAGLGPGGISVGCRWALGRLEGLKDGETHNYALTA